MNEAQALALRFPCYLASETANPRLAHNRPTYRVVVSLDTGYE
jgi:hypothetical protein